MKLKYPFIPILAFGSIILIGCQNTEAEQKKEEKKADNPQVHLTDFVLEQPEFTVTLTGNLIPYNETTLYARQSGFVKRLLVDRGAKVRKGQLLAILEAPELGQQVAAVSSNSASVKAKWINSKGIYKRLQEASLHKGAVAPLDLENAHNQMLADSAAYSSAVHASGVAKQQTNYLEIRAPFDGVITDRLVSEGALSSGNNAETNAIFKIAALDKLRLIVAVPEQYSDAIQSNTKAMFMVNSMPSNPFTVHYSRMSAVLSSDARAAVTEFDFDNRKEQLKGNEFVQVKLFLQRKKPTMFVLRTAVINSQLGTYVWRVDNNNTIKRVNIQEGIVKDSTKEIFSLDLLPEDKVVKNAKEEWTDGQTINIAR